MPHPHSEGHGGPDAIRRSRKRKRPVGGLGRGLGRILTDAGKEGEPASKRPGLLQLIGVESVGGSHKIRDHVVETALGAIVEGFAMDGLVLAVQLLPTEASEGEEIQGSEPFLAAKLPPGCVSDSPLLFHLYGNLWRTLQADERTVESSLVGRRMSTPIPAAERWQLPVGKTWLLACRVDTSDVAIGAVAARKTSFHPEEADAISSLVAAVASGWSDTPAVADARQKIRECTATSLKSEGAETLAEVTAAWPIDAKAGYGRKPDGATPRRIGAARDVDPLVATAKAAAKAARPRCDVVFAGSSAVEGSEISIVMIRHPNHGLRLGFAERQAGEWGGVAEAVFTAAFG